MAVDARRRSGRFCVTLTCTPNIKEAQELRESLGFVDGNPIGAVMHRSILILTLAALSISSPVFAQGGGTPEDKAACSPSVKRYCRSAVSGGDMAVLACMEQNRPRLSRSCQKVLAKYGQ